MDNPTPNRGAGVAAYASDPGASRGRLYDEPASATRTRRALGFIFYAESARENLAAHEAHQAKLATELEVAGKI